MPLYFNNVALLRGTGNTLASDQACCCKGGGGKRCECVRDRLTGMQVEFQGKIFTAGVAGSYFNNGGSFAETWQTVPGNPFAYEYFRETDETPGAIPDYRFAELACGFAAPWADELGSADYGSDGYLYYVNFLSSCNTYANGNQVSNGFAQWWARLACKEAEIACEPHRFAGDTIGVGGPISVKVVFDTSTTNPDDCPPQRASISITEACLI